MKKQLLLAFAFISILDLQAQMYGIDVSAVQGTITWSQVSAAGKTFAYAKATKGTCYVDSKFTTNMSGGTSAGLVMGAYHFALPEDNTAASEATYFLNTASSYIGGCHLPPALDIEDPAGTCIVNSSPLSSYFTYSQLAQWIATWVNQVHNSTGVWPVVYIARCYAASIYPYYGSTIPSQCKLWIADWSDPAGSPANTSGCTWNSWPWVFHQYSSTGTVSGISGAVDLDYYGGSLSSFNTLTGCSSSSCTGWAVSPNSGSYTSAGGTGSFSVTTTVGGCSYSASSSSSWITNITYSGGTVSYSVSANNTCSSQTGYIYVYDANNTLQATYTVTESGLPVPNAVTVNGGGTFCGSTTLTASGGNGGTIYWQGTNSNGTSTATPSTSQSVSSSGTYYFRSYNSCGWGTAGSATVTISSTPGSVSVSGGGTFCNNATITASGGSGGTIYWQGTTNGGTSTSSPSSSQVVTSSGTYYFRAYNSCGWGIQGSVTVTINPAPGAVTVSGGGTYCGNTTLTASGGSGGTIYWQGTTSGGTSTATASTSQSVSSSGTYYFRAYNSCGWGNEGSATVTINTAPSSVVVNGGGTFCSNATLTATGGSGGTIYWQGTTSGGTSTGMPSSSQVVTSSGTYYFNAYNNCGWGTQGSATVTINTPPSSVTVSGGGTYCSNATLTASGGNGGTIYWEGTTSGGTSTATASSSQVVTSSGTYYFRSYNSNCGWGTEGSATVTINTAPAAVTVSIGGSSCASATLTASGGNGGTIYWEGTTSGGTSTATASSSQVVTSSGTYYFRAYNASCGWGPEGSATVNIGSAPTTVTVSGGGTFCNSATLTASGGNGGTIYWQGTTNGGTSTAIQSSSQVVTSSGTYYFNAYNSCGWGTQGSATVTINAGPSAVTVSGGGVYCGSATVTANGGSGGTVYWQGTSSGGTSTTTPSSSQIVTSSGTYYFRAYNNNCGWGTEGSATVTINSLPGSLTFSPTSGCSPVTVTATCSNCNGCSYQWSTGSASDTSVYTSSTNYTVTATNSNNCSVSATGSLSINGQPSVSIISSNPGFCPGGSVTLSTSPTATSYSWSGPNGYTSNAAQITVSAAGPYSVTVTNPGSCVGTATSSTNIIQYNPPAVSAGTNQTNSGSGVVIGGSPTASGGQPPYSYLWTPGSTLDNSTIANPTANPTSTTTYTVTVTDNNNCSASSSVSVSVGGNCSYTLSNSNVNVPSSAGYDSVILTTSPGCAWTITGGCNWAPFNPTSGTGSSSLLFTYQQNPLPSMRTCFVNIQGNIFTITQAPDTTTGIEHISTIKSISVLPNPNNGIFAVRLEGESGLMVKLNVFNAVGQLITEKEIIPSSNITLSDFDLSKCAKGIYYVQIRTDAKYYYLKVSVE